MTFDYQKIARKITWTLFLATSFWSAGFIAPFTITSIAAAQLGGQAVWAGIPAAISQTSGALAALGWGYGMERFGRRGGLVLGLLLGVLGAALAGTAVVASSLALFFAGMALLGIGNAVVNLSRFAAAEVHPPAERGRAISNVVIGGTVGAILGPLLVAPTGLWAQAVGLDELAGPFGASLVLAAVGATAVYLWLRPDPRDVGRELARADARALVSADAARSIPQILRDPGVIVAMAAMTFATLVMAMVMVITSLHLHEQHQALNAISLVISSHTFGMYAFSIFSGRLADRWGRVPVILVGAGTLVAACIGAPLSPHILPISIALFLLGLGWNFCYVGGSALLADHLSPAERAHTQGFNDLLIGLMGAVGSVGSGIVFAALGYGAMGLFGAALALVPIALTAWWRLNVPNWARKSESKL